MCFVPSKSDMTVQISLFHSSSKSMFLNPVSSRSFLSFLSAAFDSFSLSDCVSLWSLIMRSILFCFMVCSGWCLYLFCWF